jgi:hypothetical protein
MKDNQTKDLQATIQIVWESLNGVMHDLSVGHIVDANETVGDMINLLEQAGANPETTAGEQA